ncbi:endoribonuclease [Pseudomonas phage PspYZU05]|uniref:Site-specific RNA endonuclease n=1 Tax=Pseudomonas phage PspYZU05 TaxID=1983556 RepID=A0A2U7NBS7_9CAUD|nr:endoribonuclease [Pseudomonas phage PspYZU05]ASD52049.1 site-specific RNA endonuclease [Pseudomonas phage PspYZU05]
MQTQPMHLYRSKLRRVFEVEFKRINKLIKENCEKESCQSFFIKYSPHLFDRIIDWEIDVDDIFRLFYKVTDNVHLVHEFLEIPDSESRPLRLEITDGTLWLGLTLSKRSEIVKHSTQTLQCRTVIKNPNRLQGRISTHVIKLEQR